MKSTTSYTYKDIWLIAYPILISLLMEQMIGITDTAFLGHVGEIELGASAIAGVYYLAIFMIGFGFTIGSQILIARRNGEDNYRAIGNIFYQGIYFLMLMSLVIFTLSQLFSEQILGVLVASDRIVGAATDYIRWRVYGFFFSFIGAMFRAFFVGTTQTRTLTLNSIVMVLANVVFNYTLIFGKFGFPPMGIAGAAIGSSLAELVSVLFFIVYTYKRIDFRKYGLNHIPGFRTRELSQIMHISVWTMIQNFISLSTWFLFFIFIEHLGERPLAISNIIRSVSSIPFMTVTAFASTCSSLVSNQIGAGHSRQVPALINQHIRLCACIVVPLVAYLAVSLTGAAYLYRHSRPDSCQHPYPLGTVFHLPGQYSRIHLFPVGIRNRQYPCSLHPRNDRTGTVHCLHPDCHYRTKGRRRRMLDCRTPICHMHRRSQLPVYPEIQLAA